MQIIAIEKGDRICIGDVYLRVSRIRPSRGIELEIEAPANVSIHREEFLRALRKLKKNLIRFEHAARKKTNINE